MSTVSNNPEREITTIESTCCNNIYRSGTMVGSKGFKELPDAERQEIMWRVAVSSAIETTEPAYKIFARLLHNYLTDNVWPGLCEDWEVETRETHNKTAFTSPIID